MVLVSRDWSDVGDLAVFELAAPSTPFRTLGGGRRGGCVFGWGRARTASQ